jgi:hypothetical protein
MLGSDCPVKQFTIGARNCLKDFRKSQMMKWWCGSGWDNSQIFYIAGFDALVKRDRDKYNRVGGGYVE